MILLMLFNIQMKIRNCKLVNTDKELIRTRWDWISQEDKNARVAILQLLKRNQFFIWVEITLQTKRNSLKAISLIQWTTLVICICRIITRTSWIPLRIMGIHLPIVNSYRSETSLQTLHYNIINPKGPKHQA